MSQGDMVHHRTPDSLLIIKDVVLRPYIRGDCGHLVSKYRKPCYYRNLTFGNQMEHGKLCDNCEEMYKVADDLDPACYDDEELYDGNYFVM